MKLHIPNLKSNKIGGGWSFLNNLVRGMKEIKEPVELAELEDADLLFLPAPTMAQRGIVQRAKKLGKPIVLRMDGVPEDWRNRGTGWNRTKEFADVADVVIYQSEFIKNTVGRLLERSLCKDIPYTVIMNGTDTDVFKSAGDTYPAFGNPSLLYVNFRKGEHNKRVEEAIERFRYYKLSHPKATMTFVGNFSKQQFLWDKKHWEFGMLDMEEGKDWQYLGIVKSREEMAKIMRSCDILAFPSFADPCPNTLIEGLCCGLKPMWINSYGGAKEIVDIRRHDPLSFSKERMAKEYMEVFKELV